MFIFAGVFLVSFTTFLYIYLTRSRVDELSNDLNFKFGYLPAPYGDSENEVSSEEDSDSEIYFNDTHYLTRTNILSFFHQEDNFKRLSTLFDNSEILSSVINKVNNDRMISQDYEDTRNMYGEKYFSISPSITYDITINDRVFNTSLSQLNVFKWFILNDYFLYIE
jgi:hypothetical protein